MCGLRSGVRFPEADGEAEHGGGEAGEQLVRAGSAGAAERGRGAGEGGVGAAAAAGLL